MEHLDTININDLALQRSIASFAIDFVFARSIMKNYNTKNSKNNTVTRSKKKDVNILK